MATKTLRNVYRPHPRVQFSCGDELVTKQSMKAECDIHNILKQYQRTGIITHVEKASPLFAELPDSLDYQQSIHIQMQAEEAFAALPSQVRDYFQNDPQNFLETFQNPTEDQKARLYEFGLLKKPEAPRPTASTNPQVAPEPAPNTPA